MELPSLAEDFVDPQKMKSIHEIMSFTDQNKDNAIQPREFIKAMDYFQEKIQPAMPGGNSAHGDIPEYLNHWIWIYIMIQDLKREVMMDPTGLVDCLNILIVPDPSGKL